MLDDRNLRLSQSKWCALAVLVFSSALGVNGAAAAASARPIEARPAVELPALPAQHAVPGFEGAATTDDGRIQVMVELVDPPAAVVYAEAMRNALPSDKAARRVAGIASKAQVAKIQAAQDRVAGELTRATGARELFRVHNALNGIAVAVTRERLRELAKIAGVKRILPIYPEFPTNSTSVPFLGTPDVWGGTTTPPLPAGADGTGIRVGIIDTGIDYMHANFGGTGLLADYGTENTASSGYTTAGSFPTAKVVGGKDFVGDAYTGGNAPVPDVNPMDCNGHGSHVAGTAAGLGVTAGGATYGGPWDNTAPFGSLRIGPGTAPKASLYALRVFGCGGSTGVTTLAIDWAMDPNGDFDLSDHLDVINMSLGSNFGSAVDASSVASDNAALAGVIVVISAGNANDTFFITGSPGVATRAIATAASVDSGVTAGNVRINTPAGIAGFYVAGTAAFGSVPPPGGLTGNVVQGLDPADVAGPSTTDGCSPLTNGAAVSGNIALIDRGTCGFVVKVKNAQNAGAVGVIIANSASAFGNMGGADPTITIPSVLVTQTDGNTFKLPANLPTLNATLFPGSDTLASFSSRGPRRIAGSPLRLKPDIAAPGSNITSTQTGVTCNTVAFPAGTGSGCIVPNASGNIAGSQSLTISGTSMACPHMTGIMALLRQLKPDWSVEELKALAMNYAIHDMTLLPGNTPPRFGPSRIGNGRVDPSLSAVANVIAMNAEDAGLVSVTFESEVVGVVTRTKKVRVLNKGLTSQTYDLAFDNVVDSPGVSFSLPGGNSVTVPAGVAGEFDIQMTADASLMDHTRDQSLSTVQNLSASFVNQPRNFLTEEASYLTFSQSATLKLRLPVYMAEKPASAMSAADTITTALAPSGSTTIALSGTDVCTGTLAAGPTCTGTFPNDVESAVSPFELQVVSPLDPVNSTDFADIKYVGVGYLQFGGSPGPTDLIMFGVASWGDWSTPNDVAYNVCIDTDEDGVYDSDVVNATPFVFVANASSNDNFVNMTQNLTSGGVSILGSANYVNLASPGSFDSALHLNNTMILATQVNQLPFAVSDTSFRYKVVTCPGFNPFCARSLTGDHCTPAPGTFYDQAVGPYSWDFAAQGLNFGGNFLAEDLNGAALPVDWNTANMTTNGSLGALLLHHLNGSGHRAEVAVLENTPHDDLAVSLGFTPLAPNIGDTIVITVTASNLGPNTATGVTVGLTFPPGLTYVSDDGLATYNSSTGVWSIAALATPTTLHITATVDVSGPSPISAVIGGFTPLDTNPANDTASITVLAPAQADLDLTMVSSVPAALSGDPVTFTLTLKNNGPDQALSVSTTTTFAPTAVVTGSVASTGTFNSGTGVWTIASLANGATATLDITVTAPNTADLFTASATTTSTTADPNSLNNSDSSTVAVGLGFYSVPPCRVADTRPSSEMTTGEQRDFDMTVGGCGIPADAIAVSFNITSVGSSAPGDLKVFEAGASVPVADVLSFTSGVTRANNGVSKISSAGLVSVVNTSTGTTHVVIDVNGYFK